jgi:hypothetical protein
VVGGVFAKTELRILRTGLLADSGGFSYSDYSPGNLVLPRIAGSSTGLDSLLVS